MPYSTLIAGGFSVALLAAGNLAAMETGYRSAPSSPTSSTPTASSVVTRAELHRIDDAANPFPSKAMAQQFADYLAWTKAQGLSRLAAFEALRDIEQGQRASEVLSFPSEQMAEQFDAYLRWTEEQQVSRFYAFKVTNFD